MIILGLGSNVGDRLANLRATFRAIKHIPGVSVQQVSPVYLSDALLPENAPDEWNIPHLNLALRCETTLKPEELLSALKKIERDIGRKPDTPRWGPRVIDIDILAWNEEIIHTPTLTVPHENLLERPFAIWPFADVAPLWIYPLAGEHHGKTAAQLVEKWGSRFSGEALLKTRQIYQRIDTPQLVGIINVTPDSFSDGGKFLQVENALQQTLHLIDSGGEIIDIGAESTAPSAAPVDSGTEWARLEPVLIAIKSAISNFIIKPKISVDTRHADVAAKALNVGADWINDVSGLDNKAMREIILHSKADCVVMHHLNIPERRDTVLPRNQDPVEMVYAWAEKRLNELTQQGIARERIIFDPGIGFGKMAEQSLMLLKHAQVFTKLGTRILIGHSRKTFLSLLSAKSFAERDIETLAASLHLSQYPIDYLRVHDVELCARGLRVKKALQEK